MVEGFAVAPEGITFATRLALRDCYARVENSADPRKCAACEQGLDAKRTEP